MTRRQTVVRSSAAIVLALLLAAGSALANGNSKPGATAAGTSGLAYTGAQGASGPPTTRALFTLEFVDADIVDVFQALATQSGVNIALSSSVKGKTTLRLRNVTLEQAMNIVTRLNGLDYAWVEAAYVVGTPEEVRTMRVSELRSAVVVLQHIEPEYAQEVLGKLAPDVTVSTQKGVRSVLLLAPEASLAKAERVLAEIDVPPLPRPPTTEVVPVRYLKADQIADMIAAAVPDVTVQPGPQENTLLITANDKQWESVRSLMSSADAPPAPSQATQAIYYIKYSSPTELQEALTSLVPDVTVTLAPRSFTPAVQRGSGGAGGTSQILSAPQYAGGAGGGGTGSGGGTAGVTVEAAPVTALILTGAPYSVERALDMLEKLDIAPRQVHIAAMVTEISRDDSLKLGIDWGPSLDAGLGDTGVPFVMGEAMPAEAPTDSIVARGLEVGRIQRSYLQWSASIRALERQGRARVLSNPSVTTLDGRQTSFHTGETYYYEVAIAAAAGTAGVVKDIRTFDVGVLLAVNPRINAGEDTVTLTVAPMIAALKGTLVSNLPVVTKREVVTSIRVKSGETAVLAGLITDQEVVTVKKIPFLGDIPLAGELFKHRERSPAHTEILIFVTPTILDS